MTFKDFITRQRLIIFLIGILTFFVSLALSNIIGIAHLWGELFVDLSASALTIIFTVFIIDYLSLKERSEQTSSAANLAEDEIRSICMRIRWNIARLFGYKPEGFNRESIANRNEAGKYLDKLTVQVDKYLSEAWDDGNKDSHITEDSLQRYIDRLQAARNELEQTLIVYEYALPFSLREAILGLRSELQITDRLLNFIDTSTSLNDANYSLVRVSSKAVYEAIENILSQNSLGINEGSIHQKANPLSK
jgi:hypothetical protein